MGDVYLSYEEQKLIHSLIMNNHDVLSAKEFRIAEKLKNKIRVRLNRRMGVLYGYNVQR